MVGVRLIKQKWYVLIGVLILAGFFYAIRPDSKANWNMSYIFVFSRWWYVPFTAFILYLCDYLIPFLATMNPTKLWYIPLGAVAFVFFTGIIDIQENKTFADDNVHIKWYRYECKFANWEDVGYVDYSTEKWASSWYTKDYGTKYFRDISEREIDSLLNSGDTLTIGLDYYSWNLGHRLCMKYFGQKLFQQFGRSLYAGNVVKERLWREGNVYQSEVLGVY